MERPTILLVEDDLDDVDLMLCEFERHGLAADVAVARNGIEAMDYLLRQGSYTDRPPGNPFLVLLDERMPLMDGTAVLRSIRETPALCDMPVIHTSNVPEVRAYEGASIPKPVTVEQLIAVAGRLGVHLETGALTDPN